MQPFIHSYKAHSSFKANQNPLKLDKEAQLAKFQKDREAIRNIVQPFTIFLAPDSEDIPFMMYYGANKLLFAPSQCIRFGKSVTVVMPTTGHLGTCSCTQCLLYQYVEEFRKKGWELSKIV